MVHFLQFRITRIDDSVLVMWKIYSMVGSIRSKERERGEGEAREDKTVRRGINMRESGASVKERQGEVTPAWLKWITYCCPTLQHVVHLAVPVFQVNRITANLNEVTSLTSSPLPLRQSSLLSAYALSATLG